MSTPERRERPRSRFATATNLFYRGFRFALGHIHDFRAAVGVFLIAGAFVAVFGVWAFMQVAELVKGGATEQFDNAVMFWVRDHRIPWLERTMIELTALGNWTVVGMVGAVAALFLTLTRHKHSAALLVVSTAGGVIINGVLKAAFSRPRPEVFEWQTLATSSSFPSGHATAAALVYGTVAYLAARLHKRRWARFLTMFAALVFILLVCASRVYLGVHYPSDVLGGVISGLAWAAFCMATLEAIQQLAMRRAPEMLVDEQPAPKDIRTPDDEAKAAAASDVAAHEDAAATAEDQAPARTSRHAAEPATDGEEK